MIAPTDRACGWRCADCRRRDYVPSFLDERRCLLCALRRYAWHKTSFGRMRLVPPKEAARWEAEP
jgi:hypothetical protein